MDFGPHDDPLDVLTRWRQAAERAGVLLPEAMTLATVGLDGKPAARIVLWKGLRGRQLLFFTNYESRKGKELGATPFAALVFHFASAQQQVRVEGRVERVTEEESDDYFRTRPRESQLGAWASHQSAVLASRAELEQRLADVTVRFAGQEVSRPPYWGGFALEPERIELWSGQVGRLHDRGEYVTAGESWNFQRLYP